MAAIFPSVLRPGSSAPESDDGHTATDLDVSDRGFEQVLACVAVLLDRVGAERVAGFSFLEGVGRIEPSHLSDGAGIAAVLGLTDRRDQSSVVPPVADWSGFWEGVEVHVRGALPRPGAHMLAH